MESEISVQRRTMRMRAPFRLRTAILAGSAAVTTLAAAGCAPDHSRGMLERISGVSVGAKPVRPGVELGLFYVVLHNTSTSTIRIQSVGLRGPGIGDVVKVVEVKIVADRIGHRAVSTGGLPLGLYTEDPPVFDAGGHCRMARLLPVRGYQMTPGSLARIWIVVRAVHPGRWAIPAHVISYAAHGVTYRQSLGLRAWGSVTSDARYIPVDPGEARCVRRTGTRLLAGHHLIG